MRLTNRVCLVVLCALLLTGWTVEDWPMAGRDSSHSGSVPSGPRVPLKQEWLVQPWGPEGSFTTWPVVSEGVVYALSGPGMVAVDAATGEELWRREEPDEVTQVAPVVTPHGVLTFLPSGEVVAVSKADGAELWRTKLDGAADMSSTFFDGRVYVPVESVRALYCLDASTGSVVWKAELRGGPITVPAAAAGLVAVTTLNLESSRKELVVLSAGDGSEVWKRTIGIAHTSPAILGDQLIIGDEFLVWSLDLSSGKERWSQKTVGQFEPWAIPAASEGDVYIGDRLGHIYRLDGTSGRIKWTFEQVEGTFGQSSPVIAGKTLLGGTDAGELVALDTESGRLLWRDEVKGAVLAGAADESRFYFGVKFGQQGLYAYGHDPDGKLAPQGEGRGSAQPSGAAALIGGLAVFAAVITAAVLIGRRGRRARQS